MVLQQMMLLQERSATVQDTVANDPRYIYPMVDNSRACTKFVARLGRAGVADLSLPWRVQIGLFRKRDKLRILGNRCSHSKPLVPPTPSYVA